MGQSPEYHSAKTEHPWPLSQAEVLLDQTFICISLLNHFFEMAHLLFFVSFVFSWPLWLDAEVVEDFETCNQFFYKNIEPTGLDPNYVRICQKYNDKYDFATLYSTDKRIPIYSAYQFNFDPCESTARPQTWFIEPQVRLFLFKKKTKMMHWFIACINLLMYWKAKFNESSKHFDPSWIIRNSLFWVHTARHWQMSCTYFNKQNATDVLIGTIVYFCMHTFKSIFQM